MHLFIYNLQGTIYEGEATSVSLPATDGEITILPNHIPLVTTLKSGDVRVRHPNTDQKFSIKKGVAYVDGKSTIVLAD